MICLPSHYCWRRSKDCPSSFGILVLLLGFCTPAPLWGQAKLGEPEDEKTVSPAAPEKQEPAPGNKKLSILSFQATPDQLFRVESEAQLKERMRRDAMALGQKKVLFPPEAHAQFLDKTQAFPRATAILEDTNLCSYPLYFEDARTERYGLYCPLVQPLISTSRFYLDTLMLPLKMAVTPPWTLLPLGEDHMSGFQYKQEP